MSNEERLQAALQEMHKRTAAQIDRLRTSGLGQEAQDAVSDLVMNTIMSFVVVAAGSFAELPKEEQVAALRMTIECIKAGLDNAVELGLGDVS